MLLDPARHLGAVTRQVIDHEYLGKPARAVIATRCYDTDIDDAWDALTSAERIPRWFLPVSGDLRLGGRYQLQGNAGGTIIECEPPRHLALTWEFGGQTSWVSVTLSPAGDDATRLELRHIAHLDAEFMKFWDQFGPGAVGVGWDLGLTGLALHLASGEAVDPKEFAAWSASDEGRSCITASSEGWGAVAVAAGGDPAQAKEAADRTTHFYTVGGHHEGGAAP